jgi:hypothetical protein
MTPASSTNRPSTALDIKRGAFRGSAKAWRRRHETRKLQKRQNQHSTLPDAFHNLSCCDLHHKKARTAKETPQRLLANPKTPCFPRPANARSTLDALETRKHRRKATKRLLRARKNVATTSRTKGETACRNGMQPLTKLHTSQKRKLGVVSDRATTNRSNP